MNMIQSKIKMDIQWRKVDSHIDTRIYKNRKTPARDKLSFD